MITVRNEGPDRVVTGNAIDSWPYWRTPATGLLHRVRRVAFVWRGPDASYARPRPVVSIQCFSRPASTTPLATLTGERGGRECRRCFPEVS